MDVTEEILVGRRYLEGIKGYQLIKDINWYSSIKKWVLRFSITLDLPANKHIANTTNWYLILDHTYPKGSIKIYPDEENGITVTFQHQNINTSNDKYPWRLGDICVSTGISSLARGSFDTEPQDANSRLVWHIERCKKWIHAAAIDKLSLPGDPFELPGFGTEKTKRIAFTQDVCSLSSWQNISLSFGFATLRSINNSYLYLIERFSSNKGEKLLEVSWGKRINQSIANSNRKNERQGAWILLRSIPVTDPWKAPQTWKELVQIAKEQNIDLQSVLVSIYISKKINIPAWLLVGFPIPATIGAAPSLIHWQALELPILPKLSGFRQASHQKVKAALSLLIGREKSLKWIVTEDWSQESITARGAITSSFTQQSLLLVGVGALGSVLADALVRLGCTDITLVDNDIVEIGNMTRHTLGVSDIGNSKVEAVAERLNGIMPHANVKFHKQTIQDFIQDGNTGLQEYNIIIEATGSDDVIECLSEHLNGKSQLFVSASLGMKARRMFCFTSFAQTEISRRFHKKVSPWLEKEVVENQEMELPREGVGCWHPLFPARCDDVWMLTASCIKIIEDSFKKADKTMSSLTVLEQNSDDYGFSGISIMRW